MATPEFLQWCSEQGVQAHGIGPAYVADGWRGIVATRDIEMGECILSVPERLLISRRSADASLGDALRRHPHLGSQEVLAIHLLQLMCQGKACRWGPYLAQLPRSYTTLCTFQASEIQALQLPHAVEAATAVVERAAQAWRSALPLLRELRVPPWAQALPAWHWAVSTILSRTMSVPFDQAGCLTPLGDLHNYQPGPSPFTPSMAAPPVEAEAACGEGGPSGALEGEFGNNWALEGAYDADAQCYKVFSGRACKAGEQVYLNYGNHTNLQLLEWYGFVLSDGSNGHDTALLPPEVFEAVIAAKACAAPPKASAAAAKAAAAAPMDLRLAPTDSFFHADGHPSWGLLAYLRLAAASPAERKAKRHLIMAGEWASYGGDARVLQWLRAACSSQLQQLPTSLAEDESLAVELMSAAAAASDSAATVTSGAAGSWQAPPDVAAADGSSAAASGCADACHETEAALPALGGDPQQQATLRLLAAVQWRAGYKRILHRAMLVADAWAQELQVHVQEEAKQQASMRHVRAIRI